MSHGTVELGARFAEAGLDDIDGALVNFPEALKQSPASVVFFHRGQWWPWCRAQVAAFVYEYERYRENNVAIFGTPPQAAEHMASAQGKESLATRRSIMLNADTLRRSS